MFVARNHSEVIASLQPLTNCSEEEFEEVNSLARCLIGLNPSTKKDLALAATLLRLCNPSTPTGVLSEASLYYDASNDATVDPTTENWTGFPGGVATRTGITSPVWRPIYIDLREAILFEGLQDQHYNLSLIPVATPFTVIAGVTPQPNTGAEPQGAIFSASSSATANQYYTVGVESHTWVIRQRFGGNDISAGTVPMGSGLKTIIAEFTSTTSRRIKVNDAAWEVGAGSAAPVDIDRAWLGQLNERANFVSAFNGEIHRFALIPRAINDTEATTLHNWANINIVAQPDRDGNGYFRRDGNGKPMVTFP